MERCSCVRSGVRLVRTRWLSDLSYTNRGYNPPVHLLLTL